MIVTKEQQEAMVDKYVKEKHTTDECIGFIDGINATLNLVNKLYIQDVSKSFYCWEKESLGQKCESVCDVCRGSKLEAN